MLKTSGANYEPKIKDLYLKKLETELTDLILKTIKTLDDLILPSIAPDTETEAYCGYMKMKSYGYH